MKSSMKNLLTICAIFTALPTLFAGDLHVKLVDEREKLVTGARFYWKYKTHQAYREITSVREFPKLNRKSGFATRFNYILSKSTSPTEIDFKVVADGYEVHKWTQVFPHEPGFKVISLSGVVKTQHHPPRKQIQGPPNLSMKLAPDFYGVWWASREHRKSAYRIRLDKVSNKFSADLVTKGSATPYPIDKINVVNRNTIIVRMPSTPFDRTYYEFTFTYRPAYDDILGSFKRNRNMRYSRNNPLMHSVSSEPRVSGSEPNSVRPSTVVVKPSLSKTDRRLQKLEGLLKEGLITKEIFDIKKKQILKDNP